MRIYNTNQNYASLDTKLYLATYENLRTDNKKFRAYNDVKAAEKAERISSENGYGKVLNIYELHERTHRIIRRAQA